MQSVVAKLKAQFMQASTDGAAGARSVHGAPVAVAAACGLRDDDVEMLCRDILRQLVCHVDRQATQPTNCNTESTVREPFDIDQSSTSLSDQHATERNRSQSLTVVCNSLQQSCIYYSFLDRASSISIRRVCVFLNIFFFCLICAIPCNHEMRFLSGLNRRNDRSLLHEMFR